MYKIAVDALSDPATTAPVERVFSRASYILSKKVIINTRSPGAVVAGSESTSTAILYIYYQIQRTEKN